MIRGRDIPNDRLYQDDHIREVVADIGRIFPKYFADFAPDNLHLLKNFKVAIDEFEKGRSKYYQLLDRGYLEEFEYDPSSFKGTLRKDCPIIRRCLNSPAKVMDNYRQAFNHTGSERMLEVVTKLSEFSSQFMPSFDREKQLLAQCPSDLNFAVLDTETYSAYGVIGGGIRSHFLYNLYPIAFPNRSQNAIWALYFLTDHKNYQFEDYSEFLMVNPDGSGTQQNYFYPYDLFTFYGIKIYLLMKAECKRMKFTLDEQYRYLYVDKFLDYIAECHREHIEALKPAYEHFDY